MTMNAEASPPRGVHDIAAAEPGRPAIFFEGTTMTFGELDAAASRAAHALRRAGVGSGDRVAVMLHNTPEVFVVWNAVARLGALVVPVGYRSAPPEIAYLVADSGAKAFVHDDPERADRARAPGAQPPRFFVGDRALRDAPASPPGGEFLGTPVTWMTYTSGTTGRPKGIERPPPTPARHAPPNPYMRAFGFGCDDVHLLTGPAYHTAPGAWAQMHLFEGASVVVMRRWDAEECLRLIARHRVTNSHMVPANFVRILEIAPELRARHDLSSVRKILHGAAPCPVAVKRRIMEVFPPGAIWEYYGASEGMGTIISPDEWRKKPGSVGRAFPGLDVKILDDDGREKPPGEIGVVYLQPARGFEPRYRSAPDKTRAAYRGELYTVGDLGHKDADGYLFLADRRTDLILRGGVNVYPAEIEAALAEHPWVVDSAVVGAPDERLGQRVRAFVELRAGSTAAAAEEALRAFLSQRLADFKVPAEFVFVDALPREPSGKLRKRDLPE
jgi:long-chain acyl-CoA synthetase